MMDVCAIGVVIILFLTVLKQFGILEPISSFEGKGQLMPAVLLYLDCCCMLEDVRGFANIQTFFSVT